MTPEEFDAVYGTPPGTARSWVRAGVVSATPTEHELIAAYCLRPSTIARLDGDPDELRSTWAAEVRASLAAAEVPCQQTTADPAPTAAA
ncbi:MULTISPECIES: hypothetical protein [Pseudonocardia]|uniref:Uncharacterized protein n=2 Tax=Pseudonocardia TaxID=1847 RepID=A0A1Y2N7W5_PSEAH|nr:MULTISPECIES: hypothetical protein [Pseudonocardia]OSY43560.1 hypothetical protein BG845_00503 [Pseudonocardia autotrophica]TDN73449.1 hypothetical protein C8E95_2546 [Pseudonocardia autotrophica]BBG04189.1 hypothetical protein Pdca_53980 [Pseudonocardia autotrophica]GEC25520.1 hypothetical protein PSA01_25490 [Pseudonocardia saturnea]